MRTRIRTLGTVAAASAAAGIAVPTLAATSSCGAPEAALVDIAGSRQSATDWDRRLNIELVGMLDVQAKQAVVGGVSRTAA
jgi:hypothetical protein